MSIQAVNFLQHYGIDYVEQGHKHCRQGWVQVRCPFCTGNDGWHLGYDLYHGWWNCWRCGYHSSWDVVVGLLRDKREAKKALELFKGRPTLRDKSKRKTAKRLELPKDLQPLTRRAYKYLESRNFDPDLMEVTWKIQSTSNHGNLSYRIFIPIFLHNQMVSWQCRDVLGTAKLKYIAQSMEKEIISNKDTLYGIDNVIGDSCVIVEGVTDVWRLGIGAVATFGIKYRPSQVARLLDRFSSFHILFDSDPQAMINAERLGKELSVFGADVKIWEGLETDPGDFAQDDANAFMRETVGRFGGY